MRTRSILPVMMMMGLLAATSEDAPSASSCGAPSCKSGKCVREMFQWEGTPLPSQTYGDCIERRCANDGAGACVACSEDLDCKWKAAGSTCIEHQCAEPLGACPKCAAGKTCSNGSQCASGVCAAGACAAPTCNDGITNGHETGVDCGGSCPACVK